MKQIVSTINPGDHATKPHRIVLWNTGDDQRPKFTTHLETLNKEDNSHDGYHHGNYHENDLPGALADYNRRCFRYDVQPNLEAQI
jgi:hypothetical protein